VEKRVPWRKIETETEEKRRGEREENQDIVSMRCRVASPEHVGFCEERNGTSDGLKPQEMEGEGRNDTSPRTMSISTQVTFAIRSEEATDSGA
jgi:hypothetical protein